MFSSRVFRYLDSATALAVIVVAMLSLVANEAAASYGHSSNQSLLEGYDHGYVFVTDDGRSLRYEGYYSEELGAVFESIYRTEGLELELYNKSKTVEEEAEELPHYMLFFISGYASHPNFDERHERQVGDLRRRQVPGSLYHPELTSFPIMLAPVCLGYYAVPFHPTWRISPLQLGQLLLGHPSMAAVDLTGGASSPPVWSNEVSIVLARPNASGLTETILQSLIDAGVDGFSSVTELPAAVDANPKIIFVKEQRDVGPALKDIPQSIGFLSPITAAEHNLPCMRTPTKAGGEHLHTARLDAGINRWYYVNITTGLVSIEPNADVYPFVGPLMITVNTTASCLPELTRFVAETLTFFITSYAGEGLDRYFYHWGLTQLDSYSRSTMLRAAVPELCLGVSLFSVVPGGGSSSAMLPIQSMILDYAQHDHIFVSYRPSSSSHGIEDLLSGQILIAGSEQQLTAQQKIDHPTIRAVPLLATSVSIAFNMHDETTELLLPVCSVLSILRGEITYWDDVVLRDANPSTVIPHDPICVISREDSGINEVVTQGLVDLEHFCRTDNQTTSSVQVSSRWSANNFVSNFSFASNREVVSKLRATEYCMAFLATPLAVEASMHTIILYEPESRHRIEAKDRFVAPALVETSLSSSTTGEVIFDIHFGADTYPFVGVTYWLYDADRKGDCAKMKSALDFLQWTLTDAEAEEFIREYHHVNLPTKHKTKAVEYVRSLARCDSRLLYPLPPVVKEFPYWVLAIVALALIVGGLLAYRFLSTYLLTRAAPKDSSQPFTTMLVGPKNLSALYHKAKSENVSLALEKLTQIVKESCSATGCYRVKVVNDYHVIAAKTPGTAIDCAVKIQTEVEKFPWESILYTHGGERKPHRGHGNDDGQTAGTLTVDGAATVESGDSSSDGAHHRETSTAPKTSEKGTAQRGSNYQLRGAELRLELSYGIHHGRGYIIFDKELNTYDYTGEPIELAATIADVAHGSQILISASAEQFAHLEKFHGTTKFFCTRKFKGREYELHQVSGFGLASRDFEDAHRASLALSTDDESETETGNILSALEQAKCGVTYKRVAVLCVFLPKIASTFKNLPCDLVGEKYKQIYSIVEQVVTRNRGYIASFIDGKFVVSFNAVNPCANPATRAGTCAIEITDSLLTKGIVDVFCGFGPGHAHVGTSTDSSQRGEHSVLLSKLASHATFLASLCQQYEHVHVLTTSAVSENELSLNFQYAVQDLVLFSPGDRVEHVHYRAASWKYDSKNKLTPKSPQPLAEPAGSSRCLVAQGKDMQPKSPRTGDVVMEENESFPSTRGGSSLGGIVVSPSEEPTPLPLQRKGSSVLGNRLALRCIVNLRSLRTASDEADEWMYELRQRSDNDSSALLNEGFWLLSRNGSEGREEAIEKCRSLLDVGDGVVTNNGSTPAPQTEEERCCDNLKFFLQNTEDVSLLANRRLDVLGAAVAHAQGDVVQ